MGTQKRLIWGGLRSGGSVSQSMVFSPCVHAFSAHGPIWVVEAVARGENVTPFRGEKNTNWEGGFRVPGMLRWPARITGGQISNEIISHQDWVPTLMAAVGEPDIAAKLKSGYRVGDKNFKVHLDGFNFLPHFTGQEKKGPRLQFFYFSDDGNLLALRHENWKIVFAEQRSRGFDVWRDPFVQLRFPKLFNLRTDPFERADHEAIGYGRWRADRMFALVPAQVAVARFLATFKEFPPRQKAASFSIDQVLEKLQGGGRGSN